MAKPRTGYLFKRGSRFYVSWRVDGKSFSKALKDEFGQPITDRKKAQQAQRLFMQPMALGDETKVLQNMTAKLRSAQEQLAEWQLKQDEIKNPPLTVPQAWSEFQHSPKRGKCGKSTLNIYEGQLSAFQRWLKETHPQMVFLRDVSTEIAQKYAQHLESLSLSPSTFNAHVNALRLIFGTVKAKAKLSVNPWSSEDIARHAPKQNRRDELTREQLIKLCESAEGEMKTLLILGTLTGLRLGDASTLKWSEVDLAANVIRRVMMKTARRDNKALAIPIHPYLRQTLESIAEPHGEFVIPELAHLYQTKPYALTLKLRKHFERCGLKTWADGTGEGTGQRAVIKISYHSLRHSFVSQCAEAGVPMPVVQSIVGHKTARMSEHYTHISALATRAAVEKLPALSLIGNGNGKVEKIMSEKDQLKQLRQILKGQTGKNWKSKRDAALKLLGPAPEKPALPVPANGVGDGVNKCN